MLSALVTGANGFVGQALCKRLAIEGYYVHACMRHLGDIEGENIQSHIMPVSDSTDWSNVLEKIDVVFHLVARTHVTSASQQMDAEAFHAVNVDLSINLAKQAILAGVKRFIYLSSIKVNGEATRSKPFTEADLPAPQDLYGSSKLLAEHKLQEICLNSKMELVIIRPPLVYGPNVKANFLALIKIVSKSIPLPLGSIKNKRSFIYILNLVDVLIASSRHPAAAGKTYLVSDNESISIGTLIRLLSINLKKPYLIFPFPVFLIKSIAAILGKSAAFSRVSQSLEVDSSLIRNELSWNPPYTIESGLEETTRWFKSKC